MKTSILSLAFITVFISSFHASAAQISTSFSKAKSKLYKQVYDNKGQTFYVNCDWAKKKVDLESCNLQNSFPKSQSKRSKRTEAEHIIPASWMYRKDGKYRQCYIEAKKIKESPRDHCQDVDPDYNQAHNDLVNLRPAVGSINGYRSNKPFANEISGKKERTFKGNGKKIVITSRLIVPDPSIRGDIARVAFYMRDTYGVTYSKRQAKLFEQWHQADRLSDEEVKLNKRIIKAQGQGNPYATID